MPSKQETHTLEEWDEIEDRRRAQESGKRGRDAKAKESSYTLSQFRKFELLDLVFTILGILILIIGGIFGISLNVYWEAVVCFVVGFTLLLLSNKIAKMLI